MGGEVFDNETSSNIEQVLDSLRTCIGENGNPLGGVISVGLYNATALDNLSKAVADGISKRRDKQFIDDLSKAYSKIVNASVAAQNNIWNTAVDRFVKGIEEKDKKESKFVTNLSTFFTSQFPKIAKIAGISFDIAKVFTEQQLQWYDWYEKLGSSGVSLSNGLDGLTREADKAGLELDDYVNLLRNNSESVAHLSGAFGKGTETFSKVQNNAKELGKSLGMSAKESAQFSANFAKDYAWLYSTQADGMEQLNNKTNEYLTYLDKLSKATGKSRDSIAKETEARETEIRWKVWESDPVNRQKRALWSSMGISKEIQESWAFGMPNAQSSMFEWQSPEIARIAKMQNVNDIKGVNDTIDELIILRDQNKEKWKNDIDNYKNSPEMLIPNNDYQTLLHQADILKIRLMGLSDKDELLKNQADNDVYEAIRDLAEVKNVGLNELKDAAHLSSDNLQTLAEKTSELSTKFLNFINDINDKGGLLEASKKHLTEKYKKEDIIKNAQIAQISGGVLSSLMLGLGIKNTIGMMRNSAPVTPTPTPTPTSPVSPTRSITNFNKLGKGLSFLYFAKDAYEAYQNGDDIETAKNAMMAGVSTINPLLSTFVEYSGDLYEAYERGPEQFFNDAQKRVTKRNLLENMAHPVDTYAGVIKNTEDSYNIIKERGVSGTLDMIKEAAKKEGGWWNLAKHAFGFGDENLNIKNNQMEQVNNNQAEKMQDNVQSEKHWFEEAVEKLIEKQQEGQKNNNKDLLQKCSDFTDQTKETNRILQNINNTIQHSDNIGSYGQSIIP